MVMALVTAMATAMVMAMVLVMEMAIAMAMAMGTAMGMVVAGGELGLCPRGSLCALVSCAARSRCMLAAHARSQLLFCTAKNI
jgi:hypothetical protein